MQKLRVWGGGRGVDEDKKRNKEEGGLGGKVGNERENAKIKERGKEKKKKKKGQRGRRGGGTE